MSNAQHTPGPWVWQHWPDGTHTVAQSSTLGTIATIFPGPQEEEQAANARLIAAAPELLEALTWAVRFIDTYASKAAGPATPEVNKCRAAIAKATGAQS